MGSCCCKQDKCARCEDVIHCTNCKDGEPCRMHRPIPPMDHIELLCAKCKTCNGCGRDINFMVVCWECGDDLPYCKFCVVTVRDKKDNRSYKAQYCFDHMPNKHQVMCMRCGSVGGYPVRCVICDKKNFCKRCWNRGTCDTCEIESTYEVIDRSDTVEDIFTDEPDIEYYTNHNVMIA